MTSKLLRIVPVLVSLSIPAFAADPAPAPPAAGDHHAAESKDKKKKDEKKAEEGKKAEEAPKKEAPAPRVQLSSSAPRARFADPRRARAPADRARSRSALAA